jgi:predicted outer membrane repeat protein
MSRELATGLLVLAVSALVAIPAAADTFVVDIGGSGDYTAINLAITAASEGDTILVRPGTYTGLDNKNWPLEGTDMVLRSSDGAATTIVDCEGSNGILLLNPGDAGPTTIIEGFTFTGGHQYNGGLAYLYGSSPTFIDCVFSDSETAGVGGAVYFYESAASFTDCVFTGNTAVDGGAMQIEAASPTFTNCQFTSNTASGKGGAVDMPASASPVFDNCGFSHNTAEWGGGMRCYSFSSPTLTSCDFIQNTVTHRGAAIFCDEDSCPVVTLCVFGGNVADVGGGLALLDRSDASIANCAFLSNITTNGAGGVYAQDSSPTIDTCSFVENEGEYGAACYLDGSPMTTLDDCLFYGNYAAGTYGSGGALYCDEQADVVLTNCTFSDNGADWGGGTVFCEDGDPTFNNCIIAFSTSSQAIDCFVGTEVVTLNCCNVYGNAGGDWVGCIADQESINGNVSGDPLFCDRPATDFTIDAQSPCAPDNSGGCGLIGLLDVACDSPVQAESWGAIKGMFR